MTRPLALLPLVVTVLALALPLAQAQALEGRVLYVATDALYPPFAYIDESGEVVGFEPDLLGAICARLGCEAVMVPIPWEGIFEALASGEADLIASALTITAERQETLAFSEPYFAFPQVLVVRAGQDISSESFTVGVQENLSAQLEAETLVGERNLRLYDTIDLAFLALVGGEVDAVMSDLAIAETFLELYAGQLELSALTVAPEQVGFAFRQGDPLQGAINGALRQLQEESTLAALMSAWFSLEPTQDP